MWSGVGGSRVGALPLLLTLSRPLPGVAYKVLDVHGVVNQRYSTVKIRARGLGCDAAAPCGVGLVYGALVGVYVTRSYSDFSQSTVEAHPTFGLLKIQYAVRSTDARKIFTPSRARSRGGARVGGYTATKGCQHVTPSIWRR